MQPYYENTKFSEYYFEDSFLLQITESGNELRFGLDIVLRTDHLEYRPPEAGKMYFYRDGQLVFHGIERLEWISRVHVKSYDADKRFDMGNIDIFLMNECGDYILSGDWGKVSLKSYQCYLILK